MAKIETCTYQTQGRFDGDLWCDWALENDIPPHMKKHRERTDEVDCENCNCWKETSGKGDANV